MKKSMQLLVVMILLGGAAMAQHRDFKPGTYGNSFSNGHRSSFNASFFLGGLGGLGVGFGGEFEYILGQRGLFSIHAPLSYATSNDRFLGIPDEGARWHDFHTVLFAPGFRYHPAGAFRAVDFAIGMQLGCGSVITEENHVIRSNTEKTNITTGLFAPMADISLQHVSADGFLIGFYVAGGPVVYGNYGLDSRGQAVSDPGIVQFGFKMGGNF